MGRLGDLMLGGVKNPETVAYLSKLKAQIGLDRIKELVGEYGMQFTRKALDIPQEAKAVQVVKQEGNKIRNWLQPQLTKEQVIQNACENFSGKYEPEKVLYNLFSNIDRWTENELGFVLGGEKSVKCINMFKKLGFVNTKLGGHNWTEEVYVLSPYGRGQVRYFNSMLKINN